MTIEESNKLIAKFMGWKYKNQAKYWFVVRDDGSVYSKHSGHLSANHLKFHTSWDWLMPVVEKIKKIEYSNALYSNTWTVMMIDNQCVITEYPQAYFINDCSSVVDRCAETICDVSEDSLLESTYKAVVEFIKWYNKQKS